MSTGSAASRSSATAILAANTIEVCRPARRTSSTDSGSSALLSPSAPIAISRSFRMRGHKAAAVTVPDDVIPEDASPEQARSLAMSYRDQAWALSRSRYRAAMATIGDGDEDEDDEDEDDVVGAAAGSGQSNHGRHASAAGDGADSGDGSDAGGIVAGRGGGGELPALPDTGLSAWPRSSEPDSSVATAEEVNADTSHTLPSGW